MKQWGQTPDQIDPSITGRVPVFVGDDDRYFPQAPFQGMPQEGYTALFEHMLDHDLIDVFCDVDARDLFEIDETTVKIDGKVYGGEIVYTGPLDELFNLDLGALPYRTLDMKFETLDMDQFQPVGTVNYTTSEDYTRITEFKNMTGQILPGKTILEALNTDLVCDAINVAMRELFLQIVYGRSQTAFSEDGLPIGAGLDDLGKGLRSMTGTIFSTKEKGVRYLELTEGYINKLAVDANDEVIGYQFVKLGKMMEDIRHGKDPKEAYEKNIGTYGRFSAEQGAVKYIDPREE